MKRIIAISLTICCIASLGVSQSLVLEPFGASPRDVASDTTGDPNFLGILEHAYNGLLNVGVETEMYFYATFEDSFITDITWTVTSAPTGSVADFGTPVVVGTDTEIASFVPDVVGTYVLTVSEGSSLASVTVNAGTYLGVETGSPNCSLCHSEKFAEWQGTGHAEKFKKHITTPGYYSSSCINCHNTGYDTNADNDGFDDRTQYVDFYGVDTTFVFPSAADLYDYYGIADSTRNATVWDSLLVFYPNSMELANIQCESCHGPGSAHLGNTSDSRMEASLDYKACAWCHDSGTHHFRPNQWENIGHANPPTYPTGPGRASCARCHTPRGFMQFAAGETVTENDWGPISCAVCHDPHDASNEHQVRTVEATLMNGDVVTQGGTGKLCMNCHQNRRDANSYSDEPHRHYGPHYMPQADMLVGSNAITFGVTLPSSPHISATENSCATCHMAEIHVDDDGTIPKVGDHSFAMVSPDGIDHVEACAECHGVIGSFDEKKYYYNGHADHDGDGVEEGLQEEIHGLLEELAAMLPHADTTAGYDPHDDVDSTWTRTELKAAFNYEMVYYDHSYGIHNPAFTVALLKVSMQALENNAVEGSIIAVDDVPNDQGKQVKIIWNKFLDDGIAVDPIASYTVKRFDEYDETWTGVGEHTADGSARYALVTPTLFDSTITDGMYLTSFKVVAISDGGVVYESEIADGYSVDNLVPNAPMNMMASIANENVTISWEGPDDPDIKFYRVYRSETPNFEPNEITEIGTTVELYFPDQIWDPGTYYYKVAAVDFSGNLGEPSIEVEAEVLSIDEVGLPVEYGLSQNFPNPFNPITLITFSMPENGIVTLTIYNSLGQEVNELINKNLDAGKHSVFFNGSNLSSGVYFYVIRVNQFIESRKMVLLK